MNRNDKLLLGSIFDNKKNCACDPLCPHISADIGNAIECRDDGLYTGATGALRFGVSGEDSSAEFEDGRFFNMNSGSFDIINFDYMWLKSYGENGWSSYLDIDNPFVAIATVNGTGESAYIKTETNDNIEVRWELINFENGAERARISGNFSKIVFSHTSRKYEFNNVFEFADNAAALVGGLTAGQIYRTGDLLKIVH